MFNPEIHLFSPLTLGAIALTGLAAFALAWFVGSAITGRRVRRSEVDEIEWKRRETLREKSSFYRNFEPLIEELSKPARRSSTPEQRERFQRDLAMSGEQLPWKLDDFTAAEQAKGIFWGLGLGLAVAIFFNAFIGVVAGLAWGMANYNNGVTSIARRAAGRRAEFKRRIPFAVDVMALMLEAGGNFMDAIRTIGRENAGHPLGDEFLRLAGETDRGTVRSEALAALQDRVNDQDVSDLIFAIRKGEELGTPITTILQTQAHTMRLKRSQWGEKAAAEAQVKMSFPSTLVMIACMFVILGPIILPIIIQIGSGALGGG